MKEYTLFVGGYTRPFFGKEGGEGIYVFGMNPETGALTLRSTNHQAETLHFCSKGAACCIRSGSWMRARYPHSEFPKIRRR